MKKKIIFLSIFILLLAIGGVGIFYYTQTHRKDVVFAEKSKYQTYTAPAPSDGTSPVDHNSYDNIAYILWVLEHTEQYTSLTEGTAVSVGQTQTIYTHRRVNGDEQLVDTISGGLISLGKQKYFLDDKVLIRDYISKKGDDIQWKTEEPECITKSEYKNRYGWLPTQATAYIICKETILEISEVTILENGLYSITVSLNPDEEYAPFWYQREIKTNASSVTKPVFSSIVIEYIFNDDWQILQVNTKEKYKVTPKVAPITVDCETNLIETFDYTTWEFDASAMEFFNQYKDMVPVGSTSTEEPDEQTPLSFITGSLLGGSNKEKTFDVTININGQTLKGKLLLNISNLTSIIVKVSLEDLQIVYENNQVYVDYGSLKIKCNVDEISEVLQPLLAEIVMGSSAASSQAEAFDLNQIMNDLNQATVMETENSVHLDLTLNLMGFNLPLVFDINKNEDKLDLQSIKSHLSFEGTELQISIDKNESIEFSPIDGNYSDLKDIDFIIKDVTNILKTKKLGASFSFTYDDYKISGTAKVGLNKNDPIQFDFTLENTKLGLNESFLIIYDSNVFYVNYKNLKLKLSSLELMEFINKYVPIQKEMPKFDLAKTVEIISNIDFKSILQNLTINHNEVFVSLNLSALVEELSVLDLTVLDTEEGFSLRTNLYDIEINFDATTDFSIDFDSSSYVEMSAYLDLIDYIAQNVGKESLGIHIDGVLTYETYSIEVLGDINLYLKDTSYNVDGKVLVTYLDQQIEVGIIVLGKDIYISVLNYTIKLNLDTLSSTVQEITRKFGIELPKMETPQISLEEILNLVASFKLDSSSLEIDLSSIVEMIGVVGVSFSLNNSTLDLEVNSNLAELSANVFPIEYKEIATPNQYYDEKDILSVMDYVEDMIKLLNNKHGYINFSGCYEGIEVLGSLYVDWEDLVQAKGTITIGYEGETLTLEIYFSNDTVYLAYENIKVKLSKTTLTSLISDKLSSLPAIEIEEILTKVKEVVKEISITDSKLSVFLNLGAIIDGMTETEFVLTHTEEGFNLSSSLYDFNLSLDVTKIEEIKVNDDEYSSIEAYLDLMEYIFSNIYKESLEIKLNGEMTFDTYTIGVLGEIDLYLKDNAYSVDGKFTVTYLEHQVEVGIIVLNKDVYVSLLGYTIKLNLNTISETILEVTRKLGIELPKMETPQIDFKDIINLISKIKLDSNSIEADLSSVFEFIGVVGVSISLEDSTLDLEIKNNFVQMNSSITPIDYKEIEVPTEYFDEADLLNVIDYTEDIMTMINQQHGYISFSGKYESLEVSGNIYVDWKDTLKAKGTIQVVYEGQVLTLDLIYSNETIYVAYENIKVKMSEATIKELIQGKLPALPESKPEEILSKVLEVVQGLSITDDKISVLLNLGVFLEGMSEAELVFTDTLVGFDITTNLFDLNISLDVTKTEEIEVKDSEYSSVEGYIDLVEYILSIINKESLGVHIDGTYYLESMPITFTGNFELMYNSNTSSYEVFMDLIVVVSDITTQVQLTYKEDKLYIQFYDTIIEISASDFEEIISVVCEKFGLSFEQTEAPISVDTLIDFTKAIHLLDHSIELDLSQFVSLFTNLVISYTKLDSGYEFIINQDNVFNVTLSLDTIPYKEISVPQATLDKGDLYVLLDNVSYVLELIKGNAVHFEIVDALLDVTMNNQVESISVNGSMDLLWNEEGCQVAGSLLVEGVGILAQISVIVVDNTIYLIVSNQTFSLKLNEINDFISEAMEILSPMVSLELPSMDNSNFECNLKDLEFILTSQSLGASLEAIVGKACTLLVSFSLVENGLSTQVNVSYDNLVQLEAPILISGNEVEEIHIPSNALSKDDILEILTYVVEVYELYLKNEFNLSLSTSIHTNGEVVATIEGNVYIKLLENQEFDARLNLIVHEYKDNSQVGWHQLDVQVISLTTMNTLDPSVGMAMFYAIYGNNPDDLNAVIKVKSTYTGIEDLINTVLQLMNLDIPVLSGESNTSSMDIRSLIEYIHVEKNSLSFGIEANFLFASMLDERQVMHITLTKNEDSKLEGIHADNIYVSYTNTMKYTKLDALDVTLEEGQMKFEVPSVEALQEYYDISEISNLFEALYHNALERTFSISGNVVLKAQVLFTITESIPVKIKVGVEENGEPTVHVNIDMNNLKAGAILASKKTVDVYYYKNYVYIQRTESSSVKRVKVHINEFMDNLVYYLLDFGMGLSDTILNAIEKPVEGDGFVDAAKCINSVNIQKDAFEFGLNMGELTDNFNLEDLFISLGTSMVYQKNSDGSLSLVPMIHRINNFEFKMVKVITLSSTDLVLDNIDAEGIYNAIDVSFIESFTEEYNQELDNEGNPLQSDTIYELKNGVWVKASSIEHKVTFDLATSNTKLENQTVAYAKDDVILPPSLDELLVVTLEDGTVKYYEFKGWYLDASYLTLASEEDWIMQDKNRTFYAKYQDITSIVTIVSPYYEDVILTSYIGFDISNYLSIYDLASADGKMYRFEGFSYEYETILEKEVILETIWNEVQFYLIDNQNNYLLSTEDSTSFLNKTYYVPVNVNLGSSASTIYYGYPGAVLTPSYILNMFSSSFVYNETTNHLELEAFQTISNAYVSTWIDEDLGIMGYIPSSEIVAKGITLEQFTGYEINAWVDSYGNYYSWFDILAKSNQNVSYTDFYISTPQKDLTFEINDTAKITGFTFDTTVTTLITPRYVYRDGKAVLVTVIGASAFFGAEETGKLFNKQTVYYHKLETIILHEGLVEIEENAFKNSITLKAVYLPSTLENVSTDAFYMAVSSSAETNQGYASNVKFYILPESTINVGDWLAYKWNTIKYNYNSNKVSNSSVEASKTVVESVYDVLSN